MRNRLTENGQLKITWTFFPSLKLDEATNSSRTPKKRSAPLYLCTGSPAPVPKRSVWGWRGSPWFLLSVESRWVVFCWVARAAPCSPSPASWCHPVAAEWRAQGRDRSPCCARTPPVTRSFPFCFLLTAPPRPFHSFLIVITLVLSIQISVAILYRRDYVAFHRLYSSEASGDRPSGTRGHV